MLPYFMAVLVTILHFPAPRNFTMQRSMQIAQVTTWAAERRDPSLYFPKLAKEDPDAARVKMAKVYAVWIAHESAGRPDAVGDNGSSCGLMQVKPWLVGRTCEEMTRSAFVGMEAGAIVLERHLARCNNLKEALGAYSGRGKCEVYELVERRCQEAGPGACDDLN